MDRGLHLLLVVTMGLSCAKSTGDAGVMEGGSPAQPSLGSFRAIIGLRDSVASIDSTLAPERTRELAVLVAAKHKLRIERVITLIPAFVAIVDSSALQELRNDPNVRYVEPDRLLRPSPDTSGIALRCCTAGRSAVTLGTCVGLGVHPWRPITASTTASTITA